jgi:hypothetical protein
MSYINSKTIFIINSSNRSTGTHSSFSYLLDIPREKAPNKVVVLSCLIPKSFYTVQTGENTFTLSENSVINTVTLPIGSYSRRSFQTQLEIALNAAGAYTYVVSYPTTTTQADTAKWTITVTGNGGIQPIFIFSGDDLYEKLGFNRDSSNAFTGGSITSVNCIKIQAEDACFIHSDICSNNVDNILQDIYAAAGNAAFSNIYYQCTDAQANSRDITINTSNMYNFYLTNEDGEAIDLNGQNMIITLMVYKENDIYNVIKDFIKYQLIKS